MGADKGRIHDIFCPVSGNVSHFNLICELC